MKSIRNLLAGGLLAAAALATAAGAAPAAADDASSPPPPPPGPHGWAGHGPGHHGFGPERIFSKLGLTADQQQSVDAILAAKRPDLKSLHQQMRANSLKLWQTKPDDPNYAETVAEVSQANAALTTQQITMMADLRAQLYGVLTQPQKVQLAALEAKMQARMQQHGMRGHPPGAGGPPPGPGGP
jgi:Spy/CpxP family protein refolding chaperone